MADELGKIAQIDEMSYLHHQVLLMTQFGLALNDSTNSCFSLMKSKKLDPNKHDIGYLNTVQKLKSVQQMQFDHTEMNLACARLARKQTNLDMASRLLVQQFGRLKLTETEPVAYQHADKVSFGQSFRAFEAELNETNAIISDQVKLAIVECERESCKLANAIENSATSETVFNSVQSLAECVFRFTDNCKVQ